MAQAVERLAPRRRRQPRAGALRRAAAVPLDRRGDERVLDDVLGQREVAVQPARDAWPAPAARSSRYARSSALAAALTRTRPAPSGGSSTEPYSAAGILAATAMRGVEVLDVEDVEGEQDLLRLGVRPVGDGDVAAGLRTVVAASSFRPLAASVLARRR